MEFESLGRFFFFCLCFVGFSLWSVAHNVNVNSEYEIDVIEISMQISSNQKQNQMVIFLSVSLNNSHR